MRKMTDIITPKDIQQATKTQPHFRATKWLQKQPRTFQELKDHNLEWYLWLLYHLFGCAIDLDNLTSFDRTWIMTRNPDCPIDLTGLTPHDRAWVMSCRKDCPIDFTGLTPGDRAVVMVSRLDSPIDLTGLTPEDRAWVLKHRSIKEK